MKRIAVYGALAFALFLALVLIEIMKGDATPSIMAFVLDIFEKALIAMAVVATAYVSIEVRETRLEQATLINDLARARAEGDRWRDAARDHLEGLGRAIREQFDAWHLTPGEADVAFLMLKGLSHKDIARLRDSSAATVRQQATNIYAKSGLSSRAELSAFFLEDLLAPESARASESAPAAAPAGTKQ